MNKRRSYRKKQSLKVYPTTSSKNVRGIGKNPFSDIAVSYRSGSVGRDHKKSNLLMK